MKKNTALIRSEKGQSIILIAVVMIGLLALAGLAIDGGNAFLQRRNTQNAADAASLAGTRLLARAICDEPDATDATIAGAVNHFAQLNGVQDLGGVTAAYVDMDEAVLGQVGAGSVPVGATGVSVLVENNLPTFFMKVVSIETVDVSASALAMTSPPVLAGGLRPVGVPLELVLALEPGDPFTLNFDNCAQHPERCTVTYPGGQSQHRGWLNLAYTWNQGEDPDFPRAVDPSGNANVLKDWMRNGYPGGVPFYADCVGCTYGDYIHAKPGRNSSVIGQAPVGEIIMVPIIDWVPQYDEIPYPKPPAATQGGGYYYHIVGFMAFEVTGKSQGAGKINGKLVNAVIGSGQVSSVQGSGYGQSNACKTHLQAVNLWR
jgi:Flp pilus assembly protein TadG